MLWKKPKELFGQLNVTPDPTCTTSPPGTSSTRLVHLLQSMNLHRYIIIVQSPWFTWGITRSVVGASPPCPPHSDGSPGKESACHCRKHSRLRFDPWVGKIPWKRKWQPSPVFLPAWKTLQRSLRTAVQSVARSRTRLNDWATTYRCKLYGFWQMYNDVYAPW